MSHKTTYSSYYIPYDPNAVSPGQIEKRIFIPIKHRLNQTFKENGLAELPMNSHKWATRQILNYYTKGLEHVYFALS